MLQTHNVTSSHCTTIAEVIGSNSIQACVYLENKPLQAADNAHGSGGRVVSPWQLG